MKEAPEMTDAQRCQQELDLDQERKRELALAAQHRCTMREEERFRIITCMIRHRGNLTKVSKELGLARTTIHRKIKSHCIDANAIRRGGKC